MGKLLSPARDAGAAQVHRGQVVLRGRGGIGPQRQIRGQRAAARQEQAREADQLGARGVSENAPEGVFFHCRESHDHPI